MFEEIFRNHGLKVTKSRIAIYKALEKKEYPCTAEELSKDIVDEDINLSTIYRTLNSFTDKGLVKLEVNERKENVFSLEKAEIPFFHPHVFSLEKDEDKHILVCKCCHKRVPIEGCPYHKVNEKIEKETGFLIEDQNTEIYGLCPDCRKKIK